MVAESQRRDATAEGQLLAIFDVFDEWFHRDTFEACSLINVLLEMGPESPAGQAASRHLETIRTILASLATQAGLRDPETFARSWHILMKGSIEQPASHRLSKNSNQRDSTATDRATDATVV